MNITVIDKFTIEGFQPSKPKNYTIDNAKLIGSTEIILYSNGNSIAIIDLFYQKVIVN